MSRSLSFTELGEIATYINGKPFKPSEWSDSGIPILRIQNLTGQAYEQNYYNGNDLPSKYLCNDGDILISWSGSLGIYEWKGDTAAVNQHIFKVVFNKRKVDKRYFVHAVTSVLGEMSKNTHGSTMKHITKPDFDATRIFFPPLPEQKRIAAILDSADAIRQKRKAAIAKLDDLAQSVFFEMFGDPKSNQYANPTKNLGDVVELFGGNSLPEGETFDGQSGGYMLLKVSDMNLSGNETEIVTCQSWTSRRGTNASTCPEQTIIIPKRGGAIGTNKKRYTTRPAILDPNLMGIHHHGECLDFNYLYQWFLHLDLATLTNGSTVPQLNKNDLDPLIIQIPPLETQRVFASRISVLNDLKSKYRSAHDLSSTLFSSLQHRAFAGEL